MAATKKWHYLHPRTSTRAILLDEYVEKEVKDRRWNKPEWTGDCARREATCRSVTEEHRVWVDKQATKRGM